MGRHLRRVDRELVATEFVVSTRGIVNAIIRSEFVERLHVGERPTFLGNQIGTMCVNWAAVSLVGGLLQEAEPDAWGLSRRDLERAGRNPHFADVPRRFPAGWRVVETLGRCVRARTSSQPLELPDDSSAEEAYDWLLSHSGDAAFRDPLRTDGAPGTDKKPVVVRNAWTAPTAGELAHFAEAPRILMPTLTRLSRNPLHLAALLQWVVRNDYVLATPNILVTPREVGYRLRPVAPPSADAKRDKRQSFHDGSWRDATGLSDVHAVALGIRRGRRAARNDPCPCGSGSKYKRCHGR